jgi:DNA primase
LQRVLIVEGEKAADVATKIFPEHTVISWMGGSAAASKANWKAVGGREVTVWPDNDAAGKKAAIAIITEINKVNGFRGAASIVDIDALNLPQKWDLADELPAHLTRKDLVVAISNAKVP